MKKWVAAITVVAIALATGCGTRNDPIRDGEGNANTEKGDQQKQTLDVIEKPVTLVVFDTTGNWTNDNFSQAFSADIIMKRFPNVTLKFMPFHKTRGGLTTDEMIAAGEQMDLIVGTPGTVGPYMYQQKVEFDISGLVQSYGFDLERLNEGAVSIVEKVGNGQLHGIPFAMSHTAMMYNKDIFDQFGVAYPKDGLTWDDTYELAKKTTRVENGVNYYGMFVSVQHAALRNQMSSNLFDPQTNKAAFDTDSWKRFFSNFLRFYEMYGLNATQIIAAQQKKMWEEEQTVAMFLPIAGAPIVNGVRNYDFAQFPSFKETPGVGPQAYPFALYIPNMSNHKEEALKVINYVVSDEYQQMKSESGTFIPALKDNKHLDVFGQSNPNYKGKNVKALLPSVHASPMVWNKFTQTYAKEALNAFLEAANKQSDLNTAVQRGMERADKAIQTEMLK